MLHCHLTMSCVHAFSIQDVNTFAIWGPLTCVYKYKILKVWLSNNMIMDTSEILHCHMTTAYSNE